MTTGFKMVRIPDELAERITATGQKREPFVRQAIEAALENGETDWLRVAPGAAVGHGPPAPPRASGPKVERVREAMAATTRDTELGPIRRIGCEEHPDAGALRGTNGRWWCGEADCTNRAREVVE